MEKSDLFQIGDVAKLFDLSVSSLRHYENIGLLMPEYIDPNTGYRYYSPRQFEVLNTIRYLRALDMPLGEIGDFIQNRDIDKIEEKLSQQKKAVIEKQRELNRIERKIDNRLRQIQDARNSELNKITVCKSEPCRIVLMKDSLEISGFLDMEEPIRKIDRSSTEAVVFLGKVGVGISAENLNEGRFDQYDSIFLVLDEEDNYEGETIRLEEELCVRVRFRGSHQDAPEQYKVLMKYIKEHGLKVVGFSREITMIDYGITNDTDKFVTEISIPVETELAI